VFEQLHGFWRQRQEAKFVAFAMNAKLGFGKQSVVPIQSQYFGGPQPLQSIKPTMLVASCAELDQSATLHSRERHNVAFGTFTRNRLMASRGRPRPMGFRCKNA